MSFLKNILGAFVELDNQKPEDTKELKPGENEQAAIIIEPPPTVAGSTTVNAPAAQTGPSPTANASSAGFEKHFEELIDEANAKNPMFQGTDFKEFIESKSDVEAIADEATRYRTAFNVLKRTGLTKERLLTTGQEYINIIDRDLTSFENAFNQQYKTDVEHKEQLLKQKAQELQALSEKISLLDTEMKQMSQQIVESKEKLNTNKNLFVVAGETKKQEIKTELQKIDTYFL
jgi:chromosome segregation ATPase